MDDFENLFRGSQINNFIEQRKEIKKTRSVFKFYFWLIKVAFILGVTGHLVDVAIKMRRESFRAFKHGQLDLFEFNQSLVGKTH
ncbi:hypothetical protein GW915_08400 [bacterium]|nr:hypothetical protein [bacterium]